MIHKAVQLIKCIVNKTHLGFFFFTFTIYQNYTLALKLVKYLVNIEVLNNELVHLASMSAGGFKRVNHWIYHLFFGIELRFPNVFQGNFYRCFDKHRGPN